MHLISIVKGPAKGATAPLYDYRRKRNFSATPESAPALRVVPTARRAGRRFCVQEHHASRLHYDFRLEMDGVLKSWAVPKGPTLDPEVRRLAVAVEDHPLDYLTFEGLIPEGNYGAGEVIVWDLGDYEPVGDTPPIKQWEQGHLKFRLHGRKLRGEFALTHMAARAASAETKPERAANNWLLIKKHDDAERFGDEAAQHPGSVLHPGGRRHPAGGGGPQLVTPPTPVLRPMLATLAERPFRDDKWVFEIKWDGIRALVQCHNGHARLVSRTGRDLTAQYPELAGIAPAIHGEAVLDGEIVALDAHGVSSFHRLQQRMNLTDAGEIARAAARVPVEFYAFDLLLHAGKDLTRLPLLERKAKLAALGLQSPWRYADHVVGDGVGLFAEARKRGLEGIIAKRADSPYEAGRSRQWLKFKLQRRQEAVIVGYTDPRGARTEFGALLLAVYDPGAKQFQFAGRVGTGFDQATRKDILGHLRPSAAPPIPGLRERAHWVKPTTVAEVRFAEWTPDGRLRAPVFLGLRVDKNPRECVREEADA